MKTQAPTLPLPTPRPEIIRDKSEEWFVDGTLQSLPLHLHAPIIEAYNKKRTAPGLPSAAVRSANTYLRETAETVTVTASLLGINANDDDDSLLIHAHRLAAKFSRIVHESGLPAALDYLKTLGIEPPTVPHNAIRLDDGTLTDDRATVRAIGQEKRITSPRWLHGVLRREKTRLQELQNIRLHFVNKDKSAYISRQGLATQVLKAYLTREYMKSRQAVSVTDGRVLDMEAVMDAGVSNQTNRLAEMMMKISDGERFIKEHHPDYVPVFFTFTAPSIFHAMKMVGGHKITDKKGVTRTIGAKAAPNPSYKTQIPEIKGRGKNKVVTYRENTPRLSHHWITRQWATFRTWLKDTEIDSYFVRTSESNHDATAHWHGLLWIPSSIKREVVRAMREVFLAEYGDESGAWKHRVQIVMIDPTKGSAAGYIAKYISKNIAGFGIGEDFESGLDAATGAQAVDAWRKTWGVRAFQFSQNFAPVTHWRELRRTSVSDVAERPLLAKFRTAADLSDWYGFMVNYRRTPTVLRTGVIDLKDGSGITNPLDWHDATEEAFVQRVTLAKPNVYGEVVPRAIGIGVLAHEDPVYPRDTVWDFQRKAGQETWLDKLREMSQHSESWHATNATDLPDAVFSSSSSPLPVGFADLGLVKNNCGSGLTLDEKEETYQQMRREYRRMRLNPHAKMYKSMNEKYPTWDSYESAGIDMMQHRAMSPDEWAAHQERVAIVLESTFSGVSQ
ncbi:MAG: hypothetical protein BWK73_27955 [Thiothrix lacustris]|uniref:Replication gene A protein-like domain-containing protein n=1 Tax=Thiothrix lacustris TaxID=525917 RepID=A0A1Y1QK83_9GAMM|nr:MAG: hypothetical protein BWK73_27955 [Thiothrix lacustris]